MRWTAAWAALLLAAGQVAAQDPRTLLRDTALSGGSAELYVDVRIPSNYSRVEGLPVMFGPAFRSPGEGRTLGRAALVWRSGTAAVRSSREVGYTVHLERLLGPRGGASAGVALHSLILPIEDGAVGALQASLSTLFLGEDLRDYYRRQGYSAYGTWRHPSDLVRATLEFRDESHAFVPVADPFAPFRGSGGWRPQPLVAEGRVRSLRMGVVLDGGWEGGAWWERGWQLGMDAVLGLGGDLQLPPFASEDGSLTSPPWESGAWSGFLSGSVDVRYGVPVTPKSALRARVFLAGSADGTSLPPQFQRALGGPESLPAFPLWAVDCGARVVTVRATPVGVDGQTVQTAFPYYGCDRVALLQAEYRKALPVRLTGSGPASDEGWGWIHWLWPELVGTLFVDAGRGWTLSHPDVASPHRRSQRWAADAGAGISGGPLGLYLAHPVVGEGGGLRLVARLTHRF